MNHQAECRTILADGRVATITATRRPRANRADVKCIVPGLPGLEASMQTVVRLARLTEPRMDSRDQVVLGIDATPAADDRRWELAAVLVDRMARGIWTPACDSVTASGWSDNWQRGEVSAGMLHAGGAGDPALTHLGELTGHPHPGAGVSSARAWFPLHSGGINDSLAWVEVSVHPLQHERQMMEEEASISAPMLDLPMQQSVRQVLVAARHFDGQALGRWKTAVRFGHPRFQGESWQFALVMADRLARGREFIPRGRLVASGSSGAWHAGKVETVDARQPKLELILALAAPGDRVLLPLAWRDALPDGYLAALRSKGASLACVERIGWI